MESWLDALAGKGPGASVVPATTENTLELTPKPVAKAPVSPQPDASAEPLEGVGRRAAALILGAVVFTVVALLGVIGAALGGLTLDKAIGFPFSRTVFLLIVGGIGGYLGGLFGKGTACLVAERWAEKSGALLLVFSLCSLAIGCSLLLERTFAWRDLIDPIVVWLMMTVWAKKGMQG